MKKTFLYTIALLTAITGFGCKKFLDQVPDDRLTFEQAFSQKSTVDRFLANVYATLPDESNQRSPGSNNAGPWTGASDEVNYTGNSFHQNINIGSWDPTSGLVGTMWSNYYKGIQAASNFMANVDKCQDCNLSGIDYVNRYRNEARGLRAIYYFYLLRQYGPVVLLGNVPTQPDAPVIDISRARSPFDACVDYVAAELDAAAAGLPATPPTNEDYGRVNKAILQAYKVKLLLTAASPVFNGNTDYAALRNADGTPLINQTYTVAKWRRAADAAKTFITTFPNYTLFKKAGATPFISAFLACRDVMLTDWNTEIIFAKANASIDLIQYDMTPNHQNASGGDKGGSFRAPSQQIVEAYFMANGLSTGDAGSGYSRTGTVSYTAPDDNQARTISNMYANREPRFYVGITYTGRKWINPNSTLVTSFEYNGNAGRSAIGNDDYTTTGYTQRKNLSTAGWQAGGRTNVMIRLAEIYLDYIEALNEIEPGNADIMIYLNLIRERAGVPTYGGGAGQLPIPTNMQEAIRKERRVELAFEDARYFDTRRWKIAEQTDKLISGLSIQENAATGFYTVITQENRVFDKKHYLWPIPNAEVQRVPLLVQNTGW